MFIFILKVFETLLTTTLNISEDNNTNTTSAAGDQSLHIQFIEAHAKQIIEPTFRAKRYLHGPDEIIIKTTNDVAMNVLDQIERIINPSVFIATCASIQQKLDKNKMEKKVKEKTEFVMNPKSYAMKKVSSC